MKKTKLPFCLCECGGRVTKAGNKYIWGHNMTGKQLPKKTRANMRKGQKKYHQENPEAGAERSKAIKKFYQENPEARAERSKTVKKFYQENPEAGVEHGKAIKKFYQENPEARTKIGRAVKKHHQENPETRAGMSKSKKKFYQENPEALANLLRSQNIKPTKPEICLENILEKFFPKYEYTGDFSYLIGRKNPDFINNVNGQKKIIEMFGDYWHSKTRTGRTKKQEENQRIKHFAKHGYKTLIIWESELKNIEKVIQKIQMFDKVA